jgi:hypothetical protein
MGHSMNLRVVFFPALLLLVSGCLNRAGAQAKGQSAEAAETVAVPYVSAQDLGKAAENIYA